jgi:CubicO group peptidase (beta-lactamase class C family)
MWIHKKVNLHLTKRQEKMKTNKPMCIGYIILILLVLFYLHFYLDNSINQEIKTLNNNHISVEELNYHISQIIDSVNIPGLSIAIINDNELVYHNVFGVTNSHKLFSLSIKKVFLKLHLCQSQFLHILFMKMVEEGILDLDKPLHEYLPHPGIDSESQNDYELITARMVLAHQTGFQIIHSGEPIKLAFKPGTDFMYSGEGYQYLAAVIGTLNGVGWEKRLK